jgi:hypothetical protein
MIVFLNVGIEQFAGPERREACFASSLVRRRLKEFAPPVNFDVRPI